ncbi:MAG: response regulator [Deltaproteobacteria bacterium]|nr:response regulator [Deltaproteobacteria bacterium]
MTTRERPATDGGAESRARVLVVDDEDVILNLCRAYLEKGGYTVLTAATGEEALVVLSDSPVDVVLSDYAMPGMTGIEFLGEAQARWPDTVRLLYTGLGDMHIAESAMARGGVFRFLVKPFAMEVLLSSVRDAVTFGNLTRENRRYRDEMQTLVEEQGRDLREAKRVLEGVFHALPVGLLVLRPDGTVARANVAAAAILCRPLAGVVGRLPRELGAPEEVPCRNVETPDSDVPGLRRTLLWSAEPLEAAEVASGGAVVSVVDVTERAELQKKVSQGKRDIEAIFDSVTEPMASVDRAGMVTRANEAFRQLVKRPWRTFLGQSCSELLTSVGAAPACIPIEQVFELGEQRLAEWRDDDGRILHARVFPVLEGSRVNGAVLRLQDVTAERELEHRLLQSEKMASIGQLSAGVAHEINNPVGFILSNLNRLAEYSKDIARMDAEGLSLAEQVMGGRLDPGEAWRRFGEVRSRLDVDYLVRDTADAVAECRDGADRIRRIVQDLKTFSHPDGADWQYADLAQGLDSTLNIAWNEIKYKCEVVKEYGALPAVLCVPQQLNQVFMNLLVNAAQAISDRGVLTLRTWVDPDGSRVFVAVRDTGAGIPEGHLRKIFDPFFTTKPVGKGTGLGLHLALGIVRKHGGEIRVESEPGRGSEFTVILPVHPPEAVVAARGAE